MAYVFVGLTGLPHPDVLHNWAVRLMSALNINLDNTQFTFNDLTPQQQQQVNQAGQAMARIMMYIFLAVAVYVIGNFVAICLYKTQVHDKKPKELKTTMESGDFHYKLFDCCSNMNEAMCSLCCVTVRYADTHSAISGSFWGSFCYFICVNIAISVVTGFTVAAVYPPPADYQNLSHYNGNDLEQLLEALLRGLAFGVVARKQLRTKLGDPNPGAQVLHDGLAWAFCSCCALTQESVEVDIAADVEISCPFSLKIGRVRAREVTPSDYEKLLGDPVLLEGR